MIADNDAIIVDETSATFDQDFPHFVYDVTDKSLITPFDDDDPGAPEKKQQSCSSSPAVLQTNIVVMQQERERVFASTCFSSSFASCIPSTVASSSSSLPIWRIGGEQSDSSDYYRNQFLLGHCPLLR